MSKSLHIPGPKGDSLNQNSGLKYFGSAKKKINAIFSNVQQYLGSFNNLLTKMQDELNFPPEQQMYSKVTESHAQITNIQEVLQRDKMKVVFFGKTSAGKSTVINAMLREEVLPMGMGHTTNCFLEVQKCEEEGEGKGYITVNNDEERKSVESVMEFSDALEQTKLPHESLLRIFLQNCPMLKDDVVLYDSPGADNALSLEKLINEHCTDADVFVHVVNSDMGLTLSDKGFFHKVSESFSKPNLFILHNKWDMCDENESRLQKVYKQQMDKDTEFLVNELKVMGRDDVESRVFFVSAKESLYDRTRNKHSTLTPQTPTGKPGKPQRLWTFEHFEREFEECISHSATKTKFSNHVKRADKILAEMSSFANNLQVTAKEGLEELELDRQTIQNRIDDIRQRNERVSAVHLKDIEGIVAQTSQMVSVKMQQEVNQLDVLVSSFSISFHSSPHYIESYKAELVKYVQEGMQQQMSNVCGRTIEKNVTDYKQKMIDDVAPLVDDQDGSRVSDSNMVLALHSSSRGSSDVGQGPSSFDKSFEFDIRPLCADFEYDIDFKFKFGVTSLLEKFLGIDARRLRFGPRQQANRNTPLLRRVTAHPGIPQNQEVVPATPIENVELALRLVEFTSNLSAGYPLLGAALGGTSIYLWNTTGWKLIFGCTLCYGALYGYEYVRWTEGAKERAFKQQFAEHASNKLRQIVQFTCMESEKDVKKELEGKFSLLQRRVHEHEVELEEDKEKIEKDMRGLRRLLTESKGLKNKASLLETDLNEFKREFDLDGWTRNGRSSPV